MQIARTSASKEQKMNVIECVRVPMLRARNSLSIDAVARMLRVARKRESAMCTYEDINYLNVTPYTIDYLIVNYPSLCRDRNILAYCIIVRSLCASKHMTHRAAGLRLKSLKRLDWLVNFVPISVLPFYNCVQFLRFELLDPVESVSKCILYAYRF